MFTPVLLFFFNVVTVRITIFMFNLVISYYRTFILLTSSLINGPLALSASGVRLCQRCQLVRTM